MPRTREYRTRDDVDTVGNVLISATFFTVGVLAFFSYHLVPNSVETTFANPAIQAWALLLILSSPMMVFGKMKRLYRVEAMGNFGMAIGFLIYTLAILLTAFPGGIAPALFFFAIAGSMGYKGYKLNSLSREERIRRGNTPNP